MNSLTKTPFSGRTRIRACGLLVKKDMILLIKHNGIGKFGYLWSPPGGGVDFGENVRNALEREFLEETHLKISVGPFLFVNEYIDQYHHAIELFFEVQTSDQNEKLGLDPELAEDNQVMQELRYFTFKEIDNLSDGHIHNAFRIGQTAADILHLHGYHNFINF